MKCEQMWSWEQLIFSLIARWLRANNLLFLVTSSAHTLILAHLMLLLLPSSLSRQLFYLPQHSCSYINSFIRWAESKKERLSVTDPFLLLLPRVHTPKRLSNFQWGLVGIFIANSWKYIWGASLTECGRVRWPQCGRQPSATYIWPKAINSWAPSRISSQEWMRSREWVAIAATHEIRLFEMILLIGAWQFIG